MPVIPAKGRHAIQVANLNIRWAGALDAAEMQSVDERLSKDAKVMDLVPRREQSSIEIAQMDNTSVSSTQKLRYQRFVADGTVAWDMSITPEIVTVACYDYTRWREVVAVARTLTNPVLDFVTESRALTHVGLQCIDEFYVGDAGSEWNPSELFSTTSGLVAEVSLKHRDIWHEHKGWFADQHDPREHKELVNLNLSIFPREDRLVAQVGMLHLAVIALEGASETVVTENVHEFWDAQHRRNKALLSKLLRIEVSTQIGLVGD